ncbi:hypothetical protein LT493_17750 [Streptomyces tricolor]|nr:hypothetical protein [Streptomyces tricolor]
MVAPQRRHRPARPERQPRRGDPRPADRPEGGDRPVSHASDRYPKHPAVADDQVPVVRVDAPHRDRRRRPSSAARGVLTLRARLVALTGRKAVTVL